LIAPLESLLHRRLRERIDNPVVYAAIPSS
jgi:hypothetical protein